MKILHVIPNLGIGGTEKILLELCRRMDSKSFQMAVVSLKSGGTTADELKKIPVPITILDSSDDFWKGMFEFPRLFFELKKTIQDFSPDLVHTWLTRANVIGRLSARSACVPTVISSLRVMEVEKKYHLWAEFLTHRWSKIVTVNCTALEKFAVEKIKIPKEKIVLIPNGIDMSCVPASSVKGYENGSGGNGFVIGTMGRLHQQKGIDIFLRAAKMVIEQLPQCRFLVAGDGPQKKVLLELAVKLKIQSQVKFVGWTKTPGEFLSSLDLFVLASRWEGMPNVILEAMSLRKPILATAVGGTTDLIEDGREGLLIGPDDVSACAKGMLTLIQNHVLREKMTQLAYEKVVQKFTLQKMISSYQMLYESSAR